MALGQLDHEVTAADCFTPTLAAPLARSSGVGIETYPVPRFKREEFGEWMRAALQRYDLIVPTCEEVFFAADALAEAPDRVKFLSPWILPLDRLHSKWDCLKELDQAGVPYPATRLWPASDALPDWDGKPCGSVIKPVRSRFGHDTIIGPDRLTRSDYMQANVVQERLRGEEICATAILYKGEVFGFAAYRSNWRVGHAAVHFDPAPTWEWSGAQLRDYCGRIGAGLQYTGILSLDAIDSEGVMKIIEVNPRATSGIHFFRDPQGLFNALTGQGDVRTSTLPMMLKLAAASQMPWEFMRPRSALRAEMAYCLDAMELGTNRIDPLSQIRTFRTLMRRAQVAGEDVSFTGDSASYAAVWDIAWPGLSTHRLDELAKM